VEDEVVVGTLHGGRVKLVLGLDGRNGSRVDELVFEGAERVDHSREEEVLNGSEAIGNTPLRF
jgi:hypothetical protein